MLPEMPFIVSVPFFDLKKAVVFLVFEIFLQNMVEIF